MCVRMCVRVRVCARARVSRRSRGRRVTQVSARALCQGARPPTPTPTPTPTCHRAAVRGAGPAAKLLIFIHRLCLLKPLPSGLRLPPAPAPAPSPAFCFGTPCAPGPRGRAPRRAVGYGAEDGHYHVQGRGAPPPSSTGLVAGARFPVWKGPGTPPSRELPGRGVVWQAGGGGGHACLSHKRLARWWVGRMPCLGGDTEGGEE